MNNRYSFYSLTRFFALTLDKLGCGSTIKINGFHHIYFVLSSPCTNFAGDYIIMGANHWLMASHLQ